VHQKTYSLGLLITLALTAGSGAQAAPVSLTSLGGAYTQDFDTLSNTAGSTTNASLPTGWAITESGGGSRDNEQYAVDSGSSNFGDVYSYGASNSTDRALGVLRSGTLVPTIGAEFFNNTGATITLLDIAYIGEQWRLGTASRTDQLDFQYSANATSLSSGTYLDFNALDFVTPNTTTSGAKNGNDATNRATISATISGLSIATGASFWIRWNDFDASGADDGLAIDNFSLTARGEVARESLAVPEPGSMMLAGIALAGLMTTRRRSRQ